VCEQRHPDLTSLRRSGTSLRKSLQNEITEPHSSAHIGLIMCSCAAKATLTGDNAKSFFWSGTEVEFVV